MESSFPIHTLDELQADEGKAIAIGPFGSKMKSNCYVPNGVPVIRGTNISGSKFFDGEFVYITEEKADELKSCNVYAGDLVFPHRGSIGEVAVVPDDGVSRYVLSSSIMKLTCNAEIADPFFLFYYFRSHEGRQEILRFASTVGTPGIGQPLSSLRQMRVPLPPLPEQRAIASILGALDDKIELNRRMNATLESLARAIFKSWFVDFDPVRRNAGLKGEDRSVKGEKTEPDLSPFNIHNSLFPSSFQDSDLGKIPTGWKIETLGDHVELQRGKTYKSKLKGTPGPYLLGLGSIGRNGGFRSDKLMTYGGDNPENLLVYPGDLFVSLKDVTQAADLLGAIARVPTSIKVGRMTQDTVKLVFKDDALSRNLVYRTLLTPEYRAHCRGHATGTTNLGLAREDFLSYPLIVPTSDVQQAFDRFMGDLEGRIDTNERESSTLSTLRDTLLPKLLSGELPVPAALTGLVE